MTQLGFSNSPPSFGHGHDYIQLLNETVNPADGSLTMKIDVPTPAGRGLNFPYAFTYNSSAIRGLYEPTTGEPGGPIYVQWAYSPGSQVSPSTYQGWSDTLPHLVVQHTPAFEGYVSPYGDQGWYSVVCEEWQGFQFTDLDGQVHQFNNFLVGGGSGGQGFVCNGGSATGSDGTVQGGAFTINGNGGGAEYATTDGTVYQFILGGSWAAGAASTLPYLIEDKNGNKITIGNGGAETSPLPLASTVTDTLGRTAISYQQGADANHRLLYVSGIPNPYTVNLNSSTPSAGVSVPQASYDYGSGSTANTLPALPALPGGIASIGLPDGGAYTFSYDSVFGNLNKITYPNGGYVSYLWGFPAGYTDDANYQSQYTICDDSACNTVSPGTDQVYVKFAMPVILQRTVSFDGKTIALTQTFSYQTTFQAGDTVDGWRSKTTTVTTNDLISGMTSSITYYYTPFQQYSSNLTQRYSGMTAQEYKIVYTDGNGQTLQTVCKAWIDGADLVSAEYMILPNSRVSEHAFSYGGIGIGNGYVSVPNGDDYYDLSSPQSNPTCANPYVSTTEPSPGPLLSSTRRNLAPAATNSLYSYGPSIVNIPNSAITKDGSGNIVAETDYQYTNSTSQTVSGVVQHDTAFDSSPQVRQNVLSSTKTCSPACTSIVTTYSYDNTGQVVSMADGEGNTTSYAHTDVYAANSGQPSAVTDAYVTTVTRPSTNGVSHIQHFSYGFIDGKTRSVTDENSKVTTYCYTTGGCSGSVSDPWLRLTQVQYPDGGSVTATYNDAGSSPSVLTQTALTSSSAITQTIVEDGMGHAVQTQLNSDPAGIVKVDMVYAGSGAVYSVSNPYRATSDSTYGITTYSYDGLGRKILQQQPDGSLLQWCYNGIASNSAQTICSANKSSIANTNWVDSDDESGHHWQQASDGAGRLVSVVEPNPSSNQISLESDYAYSALSNLESVSQKGFFTETARTRTFTYDSLSRLITSTNPETGTICYGQWSGANCINGYDGNGNLQYKTDARGITTSYSYDTLNRLLSKSYLNDTTGTASSCFQYDTSPLVAVTAGNLVGRLTNSWTQKGACPPASSTPAFSSNSAILSRQSVLAYDATGRVLSEQQCTLSNCASGIPYTPAYSYDLAGNTIAHSNGIAGGNASMTFTNCYDSAGHLSLVVSGSVPCGTTPISSALLFSAPSYSPHGGLTGATFGTGLQLTRTYDSRLRVVSETDIGASVASPTTGSAVVAIPGSEQVH